MKYYMYMCSDGTGFVKAWSKWLAKMKVIKSQGDCLGVYQLEWVDEDCDFGFDKYGVTHPCIGV